MKDSIVFNKSKAKKMAKNNLVVKSNQVVEASYTLTTLEQRLILSVIAQIPKGQEVSDDVLYPISIETVVKLGGDANIFYTNIKEALNRLYDRSIVLRDMDESTSFRWIQQKRETKSGELSIRFSAPILPFLSNLSTEFTKYLESDIVGMTSTYAIRFYELMMQYRSTGKREISLEDLRWMFQLQNKYPVWADLKRWVIDQATKEINQYSPYKLTIETKKTGRKITSIVLSFQDKKFLKADKGKKSNKTSQNCDSSDSKQKTVEIPANLAKHPKNANLSDLEHRVSRITGEIMRNGLSDRFKQGSESGMDMIKRIKTEITSEDIAEIWELNLQEMGVVIN